MLQKQLLKKPEHISKNKHVESIDGVTSWGCIRLIFGADKTLPFPGDLIRCDSARWTPIYSVLAVGPANEA